MQHINLETFANGAFSAQVNRAIAQVFILRKEMNTKHVTNVTRK